MSGHVGPELAMVTVLFADIRNFTAFADRSTAREAVAYVNAFYAVTIPIVERRRGYVYQLLGDGLLVVFGAVAPLPDHADRALAAGVEMLGEVDRQFGDRCRIGVGINSGLVVVGTIGAGAHRRLGVIGDPVNVASRVESATRDLDEPLLVTAATVCLLDAGAPALEPCGDLMLKGKSRPVGVHRLTVRNACRTPLA